ncbi:delta-60 repeat domain-containing protein [Myxococcus sp. RHSTA-1-4]|uniref:delta-60 repeat domain-containing protein n=1 Tax=Myxococcus sp. RHSTA-1-4 TaxID=2874601 RepID=UPI001CBD9AD7|nr:delta-60 repeat domain-containing protein [Myxococcus sp. RHSTA-1-4]MBZ4423329.1 hypothetical protein [Myxococcus sp. RHSTA-1-4]
MPLMQDRTFGNRGTLWSAMALLYQDFYSAYEATHSVGGFATGVHLLGTGSACLVVGGWTYEPVPLLGLPGQDPLKRFSTVKLLMFPPDGAPRERPRVDGTLSYDISEGRRMTMPVASCSEPSGGVAVLIRQVPLRQNAFLPWEYWVCFMTSSGHVASRQAIFPGWLHDPLELPLAGSVRMAADGDGLGIVSSLETSVRITLLRGAGTVLQDIELAGSPALPGLVRLEVASVRFHAGSASIALTAYLNHPGVGSTSVGVLLRVLADGRRDSGFGDNGLWVSPLTRDSRGFVCAGEAEGGLAGCVGRRAVVFGVDPNGSPFGGGLDPSFGNSGIAEQELGGPLAAPVVASDGSGVYVFAQRVPTRADAAGDLRTAGCRFRWAPGSAGHGAVDAGWGAAGTVTLPCDGAQVTPAGVVIGGSQLFVGGTRQLHGADFDQLPVVVALETSNGEPSSSYGAGGIALCGSVREPAVIAPDGTTVFVDRSARATAPALRFITASGTEGPLVTLPPVAASGWLTTLTQLADGSLLVAGGGADAWVARLGPTGALDTSFGTGGVATPNPGKGQGAAKVLGVRANGDIALLLSTTRRELCVMRPNGQLDSTYGSGGFVEVMAFTHPVGPQGGGDVDCFLEADGSVVCVASSTHDNGALVSSPVMVGLRRITPAGGYDPNFGLGLPSLQPPAAGRIQVLVNPAGTMPGGHDDYSRISPVGIAWLGSRLYVVATGWTGGGYIRYPIDRYRPTYPLLVIMGWNADGSGDPTLAGIGRQEGAFTPDGKNKFWSAAGVLQDSPSSFFVYGMASEADKVTSLVPGSPPTTQWLVRQPQPAVFRVEHPGGLDMGFGVGGASTIRLQEFLLAPVAGALLNGGQIRVACVDTLEQPRTSQPRVNVGCLVQWGPG